MPPKRKSLKAAREGNPKIPQDVADIIGRAWPDGIVERVFEEDSWFWEAQDNIERRLQNIKDAHVAYQRQPIVERKYFENDEGDDFPVESSELDEDRSYYLYFLTLGGEEFHYQTEEEQLDLDIYDAEERELYLEQYGTGEDGMVRGEGEIGLTVGISLVAPVAMIVPMRREWFENGDADDPSLEFGVAQRDDGTLVSYLEDFRESVGESAFQQLEKLTDKITGILEAAKIRVLR
jgi:hypothetical protein